jgi:predicted DNA-binding helix-hairpin-helix protein
MRFYGYSVEEIVPDNAPNLDLELDPKLSWALRSRDIFPVDVNRAPRELLVRIPGIGVRSVNRIVQIRRWSSLRLEDLQKLGISMKKCLPFVITTDHHPARLGLDSDRLRSRFLPGPRQTEFTFRDPEAKSSAINGEV